MVKIGVVVFSVFVCVCVCLECVGVAWWRRIYMLVVCLVFIDVGVDVNVLECCLLLYEGVCVVYTSRI